MIITTLKMSARKLN
ncbi:MAG: hypothetical protein N1989_03300 [Escherichia coli]